MKSDDLWRESAIYLESNLPEICSHTFYAPALNTSSVVIDLGGSMAAFSHALADTYECQCHVVEATSLNIGNIEETDLVRKYHYAICGENKTVKLHIAEDDFHWGGIDLPPQFGSVETEEVQGVTLETFLKEINCPAPDLIKVDIEGSEIDMFDACSDEFLQSVGQFTVEFHDFLDISFAESIQRILARIKALGFISIVYTRKFHGDVLFINPNKIALNPIDKFQIRYAKKYMRGLRRISRRFF